MPGTRAYRSTNQKSCATGMALTDWPQRYGVVGDQANDQRRGEAPCDHLPRAALVSERT
jgi:hypothetical protein